MKQKKTSDALEILHRRYAKGDPERLAVIERERLTLTNYPPETASSGPTPQAVDTA